MDIEFAIAVPNEASARAVAAAVELHGYQPSLDHDDEDDGWSVYCTKRMLATYEGVVAAQAELDKLSHPFGGYSDGWGSFGNAETGT
jgi:hypothetical protein